MGDTDIYICKMVGFVFFLGVHAYLVPEILFPIINSMVILNKTHYVLLSFFSLTIPGDCHFAMILMVRLTYRAYSGEFL